MIISPTARSGPVLWAHSCWNFSKVRSLIKFICKKIIVKLTFENFHQQRVQVHFCERTAGGKSEKSVPQSFNERSDFWEIFNLFYMWMLWTNCMMRIFFPSDFTREFSRYLLPTREFYERFDFWEHFYVDTSGSASISSIARVWCLVAGFRL